MAIDPDLTRFRDEDPGGPVVMLNRDRPAGDHPLGMIAVRS